jgi:hypothetical protein
MLQRLEGSCYELKRIFIVFVGHIVSLQVQASGTGNMALRPAVG